jgi:hypothetical protein
VAVVKSRLVPAGVFLRQQFVDAGHVLRPYLETPRLIPGRRLVMGGIFVLALVLIGSAGVGIPLWRTYRKSRLLSAAENNLRKEAQKLWDQHEPDQSEEKWEQIQALHYALENKATQQIAFIEAKRGEEQGRFDEGNRLLQQDKNDPKGRQALQEVVDMHLWHAAEAQNALNNINQFSHSIQELSAQEQSIFQEAVQLFGGGNYDASRRRFRDLLSLQMPNSTLRSKAEEYLNKIRALTDDKKNYDAALEDVQNENWDAASEEFGPIVDHKGALKDEARKQLDRIALAQSAIGAISELIRSHSYRVAKNKLDGMQEWPKSSNRLRQALVSAEQQEFDSIRSRAQALLQKQDISGLEHSQDDLNNFSSRAEDISTLRTEEELSQNLNKLIAQLKKEHSSDNTAFNKAVNDYEQARDGGDINRLRSEVFPEFERVAQGTGYNKSAAQGYVEKVIPDLIGELTKNLAAKGKAAVSPISCSQDSRPTLESKAQTVPCAKLDIDSPLSWIGNPTIDVHVGAKQAVKLPHTLHLIVVVDGNGKVIRVDKDGPAEDQDFLKKAKEASKSWRSTKPLQNGKPVNASFSVDVIFQP